jgi:CxxC motif-containing protein
LKRERNLIEKKQYICIGCPIGCPLQLEHEKDQIKEVSGYECNRGAKYARQEFTDPRRSISTTIPISGALRQRLPVKVSAAVHKDRILEAARIIHELKAAAPVEMGQVLIRDFLGEKGVNVVACRSMKRVDGTKTFCPAKKPRRCKNETTERKIK